ncbi:hypothetical protein CSW98_15945 [Vibrio sp. HA2012]|uniref:hypothetical protein n=1 Tax=Vibrio sp. HA2012 TaxID=1971595 RepID=UPI000C2C5402|nr:hypothetical protein [Vibrio sp. HA2012]PJC85318.1 hypothetical protein CSW98_15945 [Vibrio sp. HA2012]
MAQSLRCPECDEVFMVENEIFNEEKQATIYAAFCEYCEKPLYHIEGKNIDNLSIKGALRAEPVDEEENWDII